MTGNYDQFIATWLNTLRLDTFQVLQPGHLNSISPAKWAMIDKAHLEALSARQVASATKLGSLSSAQYGLLNISALNVTQITAWTPVQYAGITPEQMRKLSPTQVSAMVTPAHLSPVAIAAMTDAQVASITADFGGFSAVWLNSLTPDAMKNMTIAQVNQFTPVQIAGLDSAHKNAFMVAQENNTTAENIRGWTDADYSRLTEQMVSVMSLAQIRAMNHPEWIPLSAVNGLTGPQMSAINVNFSVFTSVWLNSLSHFAFQTINW